MPLFGIVRGSSVNPPNIRQLLSCSVPRGSYQKDRDAESALVGLYVMGLQQDCQNRDRMVLAASSKTYIVYTVSVASRFLLGT